MKATLALLFAILSLASITSAASETQLSVSSALGCVSLDKVSNSHSPVDIFAGLNACMDTRNYKNAAVLYTMGTLYGVYDTRRVGDEKAQRVISLLRMYALSGRSKTELNKLQNEVVELLTDNTEVCERILKKGRPSYYPTYIADHISASGAADRPPLQTIKTFNELDAWRESLELVPHC